MRNGAGVFLIFPNSCVLLVRDTRNGLYSEPGGEQNKNESWIETVCRETQEETSNLVHLIPPKFGKDMKMKMKQHIIRIQHKEGTGYLVLMLFIPSMISKDLESLIKSYNLNREIFRDREEVPSVWKETKEMTFVKWSNLMEAAKSRRRGAEFFTTQDWKNKTVAISARTLKIFSAWMRISPCTFPLPVIWKKKNSSEEKRTFLKNTKSIVLSLEPPPPPPPL